MRSEVEDAGCSLSSSALTRSTAHDTIDQVSGPMILGRPGQTVYYFMNYSLKPSLRTIPFSSAPSMLLCPRFLIPTRQLHRLSRSPMTLIFRWHRHLPVPIHTSTRYRLLPIWRLILRHAIQSRHMISGRRLFRPIRPLLPLHLRLLRSPVHPPKKQCQCRQANADSDSDSCALREVVIFRGVKAGVASANPARAGVTSGVDFVPGCLQSLAVEGAVG
jgi:hypothetical protein